MARRPSPFPFPVPDPPRFQPPSMPFPPPPLPPPDETANVLARRIAGLPLPLFFAIGAVVGIVLAVAVVSLVRRSSSQATRAKVATQAAPVVEHAHALFVWPPALAGERAAATSDEQRVPPPFVIGSESPASARVAVAMRRPRAAQPARATKVDSSEALPSNLLSAGL